MWTTIKHFEKPASLEEAYALIVPREKVLFSGGSYLTAEQSGEIDTLIAIRHLLDNSITMNGSTLTIGAGVTLQDLARYDWSSYPLRLVECVRFSCPSRNIRNQRTIGGEIGHRRANSELFTYLHALNPILEIAAPDHLTISLREWDGTGIITAVRINLDKVERTFCQRFTLIPSAPAIVIVAGVLHEKGLDVAIGGAADSVSMATIADLQAPDESIGQIAADASEIFSADQHGSVEYKEQLIRTGLRRIIAGC